MTYENTLTGTFISRPNRFIAHVMISDEKTGKTEEVVCHVKNTGRCRELLVSGATVLLQFHPSAPLKGRKTSYSLIGVIKIREGHPLLINMDSQAPNKAAFDWLVSQRENPLLPFADETEGWSLRSLEHIKGEVAYKSSRFDLSFCSTLFQEASGALQSRPAFMEVKGVTLEENGLAMFPDAPTQRGVKHLMELIEARKAGYEAYVLFVIQMKEMKAFTPNYKTHPRFGDTLKLAKEEGVHVLAYDCIVTETSMEIDSPVPLCL